MMLTDIDRSLGWQYGIIIYNKTVVKLGRLFKQRVRKLEKMKRGDKII